MSTKQKLLSKIVISFGFPAVLLVGWIFKDSVLHTKLTDNNDPSVSITTTDGDSVLIPTTLYNKLDSALVVLDEPMREPMLEAIAQTIKDEAVVKKTTTNSRVMPIQTIELWDEPMSISFDKNKEIIAKLWVDNPSEIAIAINENNEIINLEKSNKFLKRKSVTNLTVITQSTSGKKNQHHIKVITKSGKPKYKEVEIVDGELKIIR